MRWIPLEIDIIDALEAAARKADDTPRAAPLYLVGPPGAETPEQITDLLLKEAIGYHKAERDVLRRKALALDEQIEAVSGEPEYDRTGEATGAISEPGQAHLIEQREHTLAELAAHEKAIVRLLSDASPIRIRELLEHFEIRPRSELEALKASEQPGEVFELFADGYGLADRLQDALAARREMLGLPPNRDF